jgi:hypothetical protein
MNTDEFVLYQNAAGGRVVSINFDINFFRDTIQYNLANESNELDVPLRIAYRDADGDVIDVGATNEFTLHVTADVGDQPDCSDATLERSSFGLDQYLYFDSTSFQVKDIHINQGLSARLVNGDSTMCYPKYALYIWEPQGGAWKTKDAWLDTVRG